MENKVIQRMNFEQFLRGSLNARSEKIPKSLSEAVQDPNLSQGMKLLHGGTLKHRVDSLDSASQGIMLGSSDESFSVPITEEQESRVDKLTRQFYEEVGYELYRKDGCGLSDSYFFRNSSGEVMVVTYSLPLDNESDRCLVSASKV
jgi:hypothetical protein